MDELEQIRQQKLAQLQAQQADAQDQEALQQKVAMLEQAVKPRLTKDALQRYGNLKMAHPEKAMYAMAVLAQMIQQNQVETIDDKLLKLVLLQMQPKKKEFTIKRK